MNLLIDTHVLLWMLRDPKRIPAHTASMLKSELNEVHVSAASAWEIATKVRLGKLQFDPAFLDDFDERIQALAFSPLGITAQHAIAGAKLLSPHKDPFDRMIAGQVTVENLTLISADPAFKLMSIAAVW